MESQTDHKIIEESVYSLQNVEPLCSSFIILICSRTKAPMQLGKFAFA